MNESGEECRRSPRENPVGQEAGPDDPVRRENDPARSLEASLAGEDVDLKVVMLSLASRLATAEGRLARLGGRMDRLDRRVNHAESRLTALAGQASEQQEAIRMICAILRDLDDPYGFGLSLDERLAYDGPDCNPDGREG